MDKPENVMSLINLATVRSLEAQWGYEIDPLRFRANFYVDGVEPWQEFDWIGATSASAASRSGSIAATAVAARPTSIPLTGRRDLDIPGSLRAAFGHKDLGIYLIARTGGKVVVGDPVECPGVDAAAFAPAAAAQAAEFRGFICRGCYFIYDEALGSPQHAIPPGTSFASLPMSWRCPDCGTEKATFRPYLPSAATVHPA